MRACACVDRLPVSVPHQIPLLTEYEGAWECACALVCVQPDTASHTLSVFSISYHQVEQLVTEKAGQAITQGGSRMCNSQPYSKLDHLFHFICFL